MTILPVTDPSFRAYGQILTGYDLTSLVETLDGATPLPETGTAYVPEQKELMDLPIAQELSDRAYGGMPIQLGWCNGYNTRLNCLEYHRDSELNLGATDFILLLAKREEIGADNILDTANVVAYRVPAGTLVEVYATTLHYAPCSAKADQGFKVLVALPKGTNTEKPDFTPACPEDCLLTARNKWLLAHEDSTEARNGAVIGLRGENHDIAALL